MGDNTHRFRIKPHPCTKVYVLTSVANPSLLYLWSYLQSIYRIYTEPSAPPRNFTLTSITTFSASLSWEPPQFEQQNGRIRHYVIYLTDLTGIDGTVQLKSSTKNWVLNNLRPAFCYSVSVAAYTIDVGPATVNAQFCLLTSGMFISIVYVAACEYFYYHVAPSAPPQGVNGYPLNPTTFHLEWSPPSLHYQNGLIVSYSVNVTENETAAMFQVKTNQTTFRFLSLHPDYTYCCRIAANTIAEGPFSPNYCVRLHQGSKYMIILFREAISVIN